jgi:hypothetical protein
MTGSRSEKEWKRSQQGRIRMMIRTYLNTHGPWVQDVPDYGRRKTEWGPKDGKQHWYDRSKLNPKWTDEDIDRWMRK